MPYEWHSASDAVTMQAWPFRSLPATGFAWVIGITAAALALPLVAVLGRAVLWGLLPFAAMTVWAVWFALRRSYRSGQTLETLVLSPDRLTLTRRDPGRPERRWQANPYWVRASLRAGPVPDYLTLTDGGREVELGAFLTPDERRRLHRDLLRHLAKMR